MAWTDDVRRANETLDWIEARQGPLKPGGYARIETDVRTVRAMAEGQDDARVQEIRARLEAATPGPWQTWPDGTEESVESVSVGRFVCHLNSNMRQFREDAAFIANAREDVPYLLARYDALAARMAAAEAALVAYADLIDYKPFMEFERAFNSIIDNESAPSEPDERERWLIRQAWVAAMNVAHDALAGSREQAAGEGANPTSDSGESSRLSE